MNLKETDLNLFIAFDVIYTEKNLTKAGQVLGITQPAVSNALSRLRELFDDDKLKLIKEQLKIAKNELAMIEEKTSKGFK